MDVHWWALDPIRVEVTGRSGRSTRLVVELAWNPDSGVDASLAAEVLAGTVRPAQLWAPIGSVVLVAPGARAHPGVGPAVDTVRELWPAATVTVVEEAVAALVGAGLDPEPAVAVVVHLDSRRTSVAVVAGREVVTGGLAAGGAWGLAEAVIAHLRAEHRFDVSLEEAWSAAVGGGSFVPELTVTGPRPVYGRAIAEDGNVILPQQSGKVMVSQTDLRTVLAPAYQPVADLVAQVLSDAPPEVARQAADSGLLLTGHHPPGTEEQLASLAGLPVRRVVEPEGGFEHLAVLLAGVARLLSDDLRAAR
ncbi:hypothetical protein ABH935_001184 [Catenulispora sp. GAS73]|uniref:rod shape-determining protein n=1 Tax=Catenulispora sp. GAS73 TaxID=3156269 RepID=UPI0035154871